MSYAECERLAELARGSTVLELGSYLGRSTIALASTASLVHSVDPHEGGPEEAPRTLVPFLYHLEARGVRRNVIVHVGFSTQVVPLLRDEVFDLVFIDTLHRRPEVDIDLALSARCLRPGGCIAFHDYGRDGVMISGTWRPFGVTEAVDEFVAEAGVDPPQVVESLAVIRSPALGDGPEAISRWQAAVGRLPVAVA